MESLYGKQLEIPGFTRKQLTQMVEPQLEYYPARDRDLIADRVCETVLCGRNADNMATPSDLGPM